MIIVVTSTEPEVPDTGEEYVPAKSAPLQRLAVTMTGADGSVWDLNNGPVRVQPGARWGYAEPEHWLRDTPGLDGATREGGRTPAGDPYVPVRVEGPDALGFRDIDAAFAKALDPSRGPVVFTMTTPDARSRTLTCYYESGLDADYDIDPLLWTNAFYDLDFVSTDPYWRGTPVEVEFAIVDEVPMFPADVPSIWDAELGINANNSSAVATVTNPGDVPVWWRAAVHGPATKATIGVGSDVVTFDAVLGSSDVRVVDTDPRVRSITDQDGADAWLDASEISFVEIPAGSDVQLALDVEGASADSRVKLEFVPGYRKPW